MLVQPSFLGTDNSYMVEALKRYRGASRLRHCGGEAECLSGRTPGAQPARCRRYSPQPQSGDPIRSLTREPWPGLLRRLRQILDWQVEVQAEARRWPALLGPLLKGGVKVVTDHFGRPDPALGINDAGFRYLLESRQDRASLAQAVPDPTGTALMGSGNGLPRKPCLCCATVSGSVET